MRTRIDKLRDMAEHPRSNPHEAALARAEMERLRARGVTDDGERAARSLLDRLRDDYSEKSMRRVYDDFRARFGYRPVDWTKEPPAVCTAMPSSKRVIAWAVVGARALVCHYVNWMIYEGPPLRCDEALTVVRTTPSMLIMSDGSRYRLNGYKVGQTGRDGIRTYIVHAPAAGKDRP